MWQQPLLQGESDNWLRDACHYITPAEGVTNVPGQLGKCLATTIALVWTKYAIHLTAGHELSTERGREPSVERGRWSLH